MSLNNSINSLSPVVYSQYITGIDLKSTGATKIFTTRTGINSCIPISVEVQISTSNTFAVAASISVGTNGASYNNILAITALTGLSVVGNYLQIPIIALASGAGASTDIYINVTTGATATTLTGKVIITCVDI